MRLKNYMRNSAEALLGLFYPKLCEACSETLSADESIICLSCQYALPKTHFHTMEQNMVERLFWGRADVEFAGSFLFFDKGSNTQTLLHHLKYNHKPQIGEKLGQLYGVVLKDAEKIKSIDAIIPVPLHASRQLQRGYNQSEVFADGLSKMLEVPVFTDVLLRTKKTESQTKKSKYVRWINVHEAFILELAEKIENKHILLVDDVITTGATLESCVHTLQLAKNVRVSIATIAFATH